MTQTYNAGIYCRLSRDDERIGESVSIENQRVLLTRYVQEQGWRLVQTYVESPPQPPKIHTAANKGPNEEKCRVKWAKRS